MRHVLCLLGRHRWERRRNPEGSGREGAYIVCGRCGKDRPSYETRPTGNMGAGGLGM